MPETVTRKVVVADLDYELGLEGLPFARALRRPATRPARRITGKSGRRNQLLQFPGERRVLLARNRRCEADMVQQALGRSEPTTGLPSLYLKPPTTQSALR